MNDEVTPQHPVALPVAGPVVGPVVGYESARRPAPQLASHLLAEWFRWASIAVALDVVPFALMWARSQLLIDRVMLNGLSAIGLSIALGAIAIVTVVRLIKLTIRAQGVARGCYAFLAFLNFKAGLFACAMMAIVMRL